MLARLRILGESGTTYAPVAGHFLLGRAFSEPSLESSAPSQQAFRFLWQLLRPLFKPPDRFADQPASLTQIFRPPHDSAERESIDLCVKHDHVRRRTHRPRRGASSQRAFDLLCQVVQPVRGL
jgi:hypothetical protein